MDRENTTAATQRKETNNSTINNAPAQKPRTSIKHKKAMGRFTMNRLLSNDTGTSWKSKKNDLNNTTVSLEPVKEMP